MICFLMTLSILVAFIRLSSLRLPQRLTPPTISSPPTSFWNLFPLISLKVPRLCSLSFTLSDNSFPHGLLLVPPAPLVRTRRCVSLVSILGPPHALPILCPSVLSLFQPRHSVGGVPANTLVQISGATSLSQLFNHLWKFKYHLLPRVYYVPNYSLLPAATTDLTLFLTFTSTL